MYSLIRIQKRVQFPSFSLLKYKYSLLFDPSRQINPAVDHRSGEGVNFPSLKTDHPLINTSTFRRYEAMQFLERRSR